MVEFLHGDMYQQNAHLQYANYQIIAEDGVIPQGDVVVTTAQLDQLANVQGKKALYVTVLHAIRLGNLDGAIVQQMNNHDHHQNLQTQ
jgi:hypothetical protein